MGVKIVTYESEGTSGFQSHRADMSGTKERLAIWGSRSDGARPALDLAEPHTGCLLHQGSLPYLLSESDTGN